MRTVTERPKRDRARAVGRSLAPPCGPESEELADTRRRQRLMFFRPWYEDRKVVELAGDARPGIAYALPIAREVLALCRDPERCATPSEGGTPYVPVGPMPAHAEEFPEGDLVLALQDVSSLGDPEKWIPIASQRFAAGVLAFEHDASEDPRFRDPDAVRDWLRDRFPSTEWRFFFQERAWPGRIRSEPAADALATLAVFGDLPTPNWPTVGVLIASAPPQGLHETLDSFASRYAGPLRFAATVAEGVDLAREEGLGERYEGSVRFVTVDSRTGPIRAANRALGELLGAGPDLVVVVNGPVDLAEDCLGEMVHAMDELRKADRKPGAIGPMSPQAGGPQHASLGHASNRDEFCERAWSWRREHSHTVFETVRLSEFLTMIAPECLEAVGGYDPRFSTADLREDDWALRARLAGWSLWVAEGALVHRPHIAAHRSSPPELELTLQRDLQRFCEKWTVREHEDAFRLSAVPRGTALRVPFEEPFVPPFPLRLGTREIDLVHEATAVELCGWLYHHLQNAEAQERRAVIDFVERLRGAA